MTRIFAVIAAGLLLVPLIAMQVTSAVNWTALDFAVAAILMATAIVGVELASRYIDRGIGRFIALAAIAAAFLLIWAEGAVGLFD